MEIQYITLREAAKQRNMEYDTFRYHVNKGTGPKYIKKWGRKLFDPEEVFKWIHVPKVKLNGK